VEEVKNFVFPLWNPYDFNGHPLFAALQPGVLYPPSILYLFLPFDWAFNLNIEIHFALAGWFTYLLLRGMKASQGASLISGASFMLSGYLISVHHLLSTLLSVTWVPLFLLCYFSAIRNNNPGHAILSGIVGVLMFLGGGIEVCYLIFGVAFFLTLFPGLIFELDDFIKIRRRLVFFAIFCAVFFGLSAVQLIPFLELSQLSIRSGGLSYIDAGTWSLHPYELVEFFIPDQYGVGTDLKRYWANQNWLRTIYMGGIPFILAIFFLKKWDRQAQAFLLLFFISLALAMGKNTLFHHFLYDYLPFFNKLRYPVKFIFMAVLILSIVAGLGYDYFKKELVGNKPESQRWARYILSLGFFCMFAFGIFNLFNEPLVAYFKTIGWDHPNYNETESNLFNIKRFLAFSSLFCLGLYLYSRQKLKHKFVQVALIALFISDLFFAHFKFYDKENYIEIQKVGEGVKFMQSDPEQFRFYVTSKTRKALPSNIKDWEGIDIKKEKLLMDLLGNRSLHNIDGIGVTKQARWKKILDLVKSAPPTDSLMLLNLMNVKYVVSIPPITSPNFKLVNSVYPRVQDPEKNRELENIVGIKIYENKTMLPRAFLVPACKVVKNEEKYKKYFQDRLLEPKKLVLLEKQPEGFNCEKKYDSNLKKHDSVETTLYKSNTVDLVVNSSSRQFLFMSDSYYPGWKAYVDGEEREIYRANYLFRAVIVEPGKHSVRFEYDPLSFKLGLAISMTTILLCGGYFWRKKNRNKLQEHMD